VFSYKKIEREPSPEAKKATINDSLKIFCYDSDQNDSECSVKSNTSIDSSSQEELASDNCFDNNVDFKDELKQLPFISSWLLDDN